MNNLVRIPMTPIAQTMRKRMEEEEADGRMRLKAQEKE